MNIKSAFIRKRGEKFHVYVEYVEEETGKKKQKSYGSYEKKKDAEKHLIEIKSTINNNKFITPNKTTLVERCYKYIMTNEKNWSPYTVINRKSWVKNYIEPFFKDTKLIDINPVLIQTFINTTFNNCTFSSSKIRYRFISSVLKEAYRLREINENPCDFVKLPHKENSSKIEIYNREEALLLIEKLNNSNIEIPILLMLTLGLRLGEATGLRWTDVDLNIGSVSVSQTLIYANNKIEFKEPKTSKSRRTLSAPDELIEKLKIEKLRQNKLKLQGILKNENNLVCLNKDYNPFLPATLRKSFHRFIKKNNLKNIRMHDLRHTNASLLLLGGTNMKVVSERLGHTDIQITMNRYSHVLEEMDKKASDNLSKILFK
ncbi:TPA: site-specific integrase [Clostridioides difficile]|uniref:site-specific integrase n=1 Tax=Clostridioides difficile TaxID=1496 RepID=UPI000B0EACE2|nr:site-specific integrase [Clostridioides difficile]MDB3184647.1 site-specific integrase [Clostridioides difficile]MDV9538320.1 site-specific integrase [Clostridioides difficile]HBE8785673.1 site-specific integrase [Clostridioides difficile]HBF1268511.1 site-specific integrase [Clostridioides difficile]HBF2871785.1 site-specific integrase [Clostridioides difficile]